MSDAIEVKRTFDRFPSWDERNRQYNIRSQVKGMTPRSYTWNIRTADGNPLVLDQKYDGACVGFAWMHELMATPHMVVPQHRTLGAYWAGCALAKRIYTEAQKIDEWIGQAYEGTSILAGAKVIKRSGLMPEYRWAFNIVDLLTVTSRHTPTIFGCNWYSTMSKPKVRNGVHWVTPEGGYVEGGHAFAIIGVNVKGRYATILNSWGTGWGDNGRARISWTDLNRLLQEDGECCVPMRVYSRNRDMTLSEDELLR